MYGISRRSLLAGSSATIVSASAFELRAQGAAPAWPTKPVKIVVPVAAGTATDLTARIFGDKLSTRWRQGFVVENKPGADGLIALGSFVSGRDDHTLLFSFSTAVSLNPLVHAKLPYDPASDLVPIATTSEVLFVIAVNESLPVKSIADLKAFANANPGKVNWAAAPGLPRFVLERHRREHGIDMAYVGYTQTGTAVQDVGEGRIQLLIASVNTLLPVIEAGKARALVIASSGRSGLLAGVPHAAEAGFPHLAVPAIGCVYGWKGMSDALRDKVATDIEAVVQDGTVEAQLAKVGQLLRRSTPASVTKLLADQRRELADLAAIMKHGK